MVPVAILCLGYTSLYLLHISGSMLVVSVSTSNPLCIQNNIFFFKLKVISRSYNDMKNIPHLQVPEFETYFFVELYAVSTGAALNSSARFAFITVLESDAPRGLVYFAVGSRFAVAYKKTTLISLQVLRDSSTSVTTMVSYSMQVRLVLLFLLFNLISLLFLSLNHCSFSKVTVTSIFSGNCQTLAGSIWSSFSGFPLVKRPCSYCIVKSDFVHSTFQ